MDERSRVFVAEDHPVFLEALLRMFGQRPELEVVGRAADGHAALEGVRKLRPDVAVTDVEMPELDGLAILRSIHREGLTTRVVILSGSLDDERIYAAIAEGARGLLAKTDTRDEICDAVAAVAVGRTVVSGAFHAGIASHIRDLNADQQDVLLSEREHEVLRLTAAGLTGPQIGETLHLAVPTIRTHMQHVFKKLGVSTAPAAVAEAMRRRLLD